MLFEGVVWVTTEKPPARTYLYVSKELTAGQPLAVFRVEFTKAPVITGVS